MRDRIRVTTTTAAAQDDDLLAVASAVGVLRPSRTAPLLDRLPAGFAPAASDPLREPATVAACARANARGL